MNIGEITDIFYQVFYLAVMIAGPMLILSMIVGIIISILQAATQIQEQTLTFIPKLLVIGITLLITGNSILTMLQEFATGIFQMIAQG